LAQLHGAELPFPFWSCASRSTRAFWIIINVLEYCCCSCTFRRLRRHIVNTRKILTLVVLLWRRNELHRNEPETEVVFACVRKHWSLPWRGGHHIQEWPLFDRLATTNVLYKAL
jgi:hypothetical protein